MKNKDKFSNRYKLVIIFIIVISVITVNYLSDTDVIARLIVEQGSVEVDSGDGFKEISLDMDLTRYDEIRNIDAQAAVILYDSIFIDLEPGTQIFLEDLSKKHIKIEQESGLTWIKFTKITGIDSFTISSANTVAVVRGTEFGFSDYEVLVAEGEVLVESEGQTIILNALEKLTRSIGFPDLAAMPVMADYDGDYPAPSASMPQETLEKSVMSAQDIDTMKNKKELMLSHMRKAGVTN